MPKCSWLLTATLPMLIAHMSIYGAVAERKCTVKESVGTVKIRRGTSTVWNDVKPKMPVKESDALRTFVESEVELETSEGTSIKIGENTTVELKQLYGDSSKQNTSVKILNGAVIANVKKLVSTNSSFDFETPTATAAIRGTIVGFEVTKEQTRVKVYEGKVWVVPQGAKKGIEIQPNQMGVVKKGMKDVAVEKIDNSTPKLLSVAKKDTSSLPMRDTSGAVPADSNSADSTKRSAPEDSSGQSLNQKPPVKTQKLNFQITSPFDGMEIKKPLITISGTVTPGAEVSAMSMRIPVTSNGSFNSQVPIANETGEYTLEFEAALEGMSQKITRKVIYKPEYRFILSSPGDRQTITTTLFPVKGEVLPAGCEVTVMGRKMSVTDAGQFTGMITIPDEEGEIPLEFEITGQGISKTEVRRIVYARPPDINRPQISASLAKGCWSITVFDRTIDEEITLFYEIDDVQESKSMRPNESTCLPLEDGIHAYKAYAQDKTGNVSTTEFLNDHPYLATSAWYIKMRKPAGNIAIDLPPSSPGGEPAVYPFELTIEKLPEDNMNLIREVVITNRTSGRKVNIRTFTDNFIEADIELVRSKNNVIQIDVNDINNVIRSQTIQINVQ